LIRREPCACPVKETATTDAVSTRAIDRERIYTFS
jgi:hypothetical protein